MAHPGLEGGSARLSQPPMPEMPLSVMDPNIIRLLVAKELDTLQFLLRHS
jgi:hypothetical protein